MTRVQRACQWLEAIYAPTRLCRIRTVHYLDGTIITWHEHCRGIDFQIADLITDEARIVTDTTHEYRLKP